MHVALVAVIYTPAGLSVRRLSMWSRRVPKLQLLTASELQTGATCSCTATQPRGCKALGLACTATCFLGFSTRACSMTKLTATWCECQTCLCCERATKSGTSTTAGSSWRRSLAEAFNRRAYDTNQQQYTAVRFTHILRKAFELDEEGNDDAHGLLEVCRQVISDDKRLDVDSFVELQQFTYDAGSYLHDLITGSAFLDAARRVLTHRTFTDSLAEKLREVGFGIGLCT